MTIKDKVCDCLHLFVTAYVGLATIAGFIWWFVYADSGPKLPYVELVSYVSFKNSCGKVVGYLSFLTSDDFFKYTLYSRQNVNSDYVRIQMFWDQILLFWQNSGIFGPFGESLT